MTPQSRTQIVCTIGPASKTPEVLDGMIAHGMDVARLNFSHGTHAEHGELIREIRAAAARANRRIPIIQDLSGPRVKTDAGHGIAESFTDVTTEKDLADLAFGLEQNMEYVCQSYVGGAGDVSTLRKHIRKLGGKIKVMAKVERQEALDNITEIVMEADAVMLGRGDLGQAIPIERLPFAEAMVIRVCKEFKKPVIVATEMLETMIEKPNPTRAEITDIAYAIILGADATMLSAESALGKYPVEAVSVMERVILEAERYEREVNPL